jgi:hypothetical protein
VNYGVAEAYCLVGVQSSAIAPRSTSKTSSSLVAKLPPGNAILKAQASLTFEKLELLASGSQTGAWEPEESRLPNF